MDIPDGDLVRLARDGDPAALRLLVERHLPMARARAARLCPQPDDADDAVQDAFLQALLAAVFRAGEQDPEPAVMAGEPDRQRPVASVVGEDDEHVADIHPPVWRAPGPRVGVRDADSGHGGPPGDGGYEVWAVRRDVLA